MNGDLLTRAVVVGDRQIPVLVIAGPGGTGKSALAGTVAQLLTRAQQGPNVLLVDGDLQTRGLTARMEEEVLKREVRCKCLGDVLVGRNHKVEPLDLGDSPQAAEWNPLRGEGRVHLVPSAYPGAQLYDTVHSLDVGKLAELVGNMLSYAAGRCNAKFVVADTPCVPDRCGAVLASFADLLLLVGNEAKTYEDVETHRRGLAIICPEVHRVQPEWLFNMISPPRDAIPMRLHFIPGLRQLNAPDVLGLGDRFRFAVAVNALLGSTLRLKHAWLVPPWHAALPREWREGLQACSAHLGPLPALTRAAIALPLALGLKIGVPRARAEQLRRKLATADLSWLERQASLGQVRSMQGAFSKLRTMSEGIPSIEPERSIAP